jgi:ribonuclease-3
MRSFFRKFTDPPLADFEGRLGHRFRDRDLLRRALTHRSYDNEKGLGENYERLEFLGDAVLGLIAAEFLFREYPDRAEGKLSKIKSYAVSSVALARFAEGLGLGKALLIGVGEERSGGRTKSSLLADSFEAVLGAVFLDGGLEAARRVISPLLEQVGKAEPEGVHRDSKTLLQQLVQARGWRVPEYREIASEGPDHKKQFTIECLIEGERTGEGIGSSKKIAEQKAAGAAIESLQGVDPIGGDS